ncbi:histidine kinase [Bhargavaea ullalensis]|uniref:Signal transduction histidine kinase n=1 Tax=Bhargavaea ullalensis TaxID=1265685 RepID=A0ABV2GE84_9BACL
MKRFFFIFLSAVIILLTFLELAGDRSRHPEVPVREGQAAANWAPGDRPVALNGEWAFYDGEFVDPKRPPENSRADRLARVPEKRFSGNNGFHEGTFRILIDVGRDGYFGLKIGSIRQASRVYINGFPAGDLEGARSEAEASFKEGPYMAFGKSEDGKLDVIIHAKNNGLGNGMFVRPILFGGTEAIVLQSTRSKVQDGMITGGFFLLSLIVLLHYLIGRREVHELFFALFCLVLGVYVATVEERLVYTVIPELSPFVLISVQMSALVLSTILYALFIERLFMGRTGSRRGTALILLLTGFAVLPLVPGFTEFTMQKFPIRVNLGVILSILAGGYAYAIVAMVKAFTKKKIGAEYLLVATVAFSCYGLMLWHSFLTGKALGMIPLLFFALMSLMFGLFIAGKRQQAIDQSARLSDELAVQDRFKRRFLVRTAHEMEGPLSDMLAEMESLMGGEEGDLNRAQQERALSIGRKGRRLQRAIETLKYASDDQPVGNLHPESISAAVVLEMIEGTAAMLETEDSVPIRFEVEPGLPAIWADEQSLRQVLFHVTSFVLRTTEKGEIRVCVKEEGAKVLLQITGCESHRLETARLFDPFYHSSRSGKADEGMDLGLPIAKRLAGLMGGQMTAADLPDGKCRFTLELPSAVGNGKEAGGADPAMRPAVLPAGWTGEGSSGIQVLLVDGSPERLGRFRRLLEGEGHRVFTVQSGMNAIAELRHSRFDLAVVGVRLPDRSGYSVSKWIRRRHQAIELPVLLIAELNELVGSAAADNDSVTDFVSPAAEDAKFLSRIRSLLAMKKTVEASVQRELSGYHGQIVPHFLYNTLNTIIGLSYDDPDRMREALEHLSVYFRTKLDYQKQQGLVTLEDEVELVRSYLAIEKLRFGDRLTIFEDVDETVECMIPSMTIQPFVENAIKHGLAGKSAGAELKWSVKRSAGMVEICVFDNGAGIPDEQQKVLLGEETGRIGFRNPMQKIRLIANSEFKLESAKGKGTHIVIRLPVGEETVKRREVPC